MLHEVPEGWRGIRLGDVAHESRVRNLDRQISQERLVGVFKGEGMVPTRDRVRGESVERCKIVAPGAFAYNPMRLNIGSIARWHGSEVAIVSPDYVVFEADPALLDGAFLDHLRASVPWQKFTARAGDGGVRVRIYFDDLAEFRFALPPLSEQRRISEILSSVDEAIQAAQAVVEQTRTIKQGMLDQLLAKGIGHTRLKDTVIGEIPETWEAITLGSLLRAGDIIDIQDGNHGEKHPKVSDYVEEGIPFIMARDITDRTLDLEGSAKITRKQADSLRVGRSLPGDVLLTHKGTVGRVGITPNVPSYVMLTPQVTYYRVSAQGRLDRDYLATVFGGTKFREALMIGSDQSTRKYIGITEQKKLVIPLPSYNEQLEISAKVAGVEEVECAASRELTQLLAIKKSLMSDLLTGRKRVSTNLLMAAE
ncbi:restriction endonuclease subunit S [Microvirga sp. BT689]|uniref:restriction endonuclease subunit S n=1 Tax=Microvirga arvi TaxID=2778731 RepID=UPI0019513047|nr:restriction endonuclease subunit S [Microvirga arvi]MBM6583989.1 restriction endonuclease subunit S [Microvirga arvi]